MVENNDEAYEDGIIVLRKKPFPKGPKMLTWKKFAKPRLRLISKFSDFFLCENIHQTKPEFFFRVSIINTVENSSQIKLQHHIQNSRN